LNNKSNSIIDVVGSLTMEFSVKLEINKLAASRRKKDRILDRAEKLMMKILSPAPLLIQ